jgi:predicted nucleic acid-binding protein
VHGQLFHTAYGLDYNDAVVKRSLLSNNSEVVFDEDDGWGLTVGYGALITGP